MQTQKSYSNFLDFFARSFLILKNNFSCAEILQQEITNYFFYSIVIFITGTSYYLYFQVNCDKFFPVIILIFIYVLIFCLLSFWLGENILLKALIIFILGIFYGKIYFHYFSKDKYYEHKFYINSTAKIIDIKPFYNSQTRQVGANILLKNLELKKMEFLPNKKTVKKFQKSKKPKKKKTKNSKKSTKKILKKSKNSSKKLKKIAKKLYKNYLNVNNYLEIDRQFIDYKKFYNQPPWIVKNQDLVLENPPTKMSLILSKYLGQYQINDLINFNALISPISKQEFKKNFNPKFDAMAKNIGAFGYFIKFPQIIERQKINNFDEYILQKRLIISQKIREYLPLNTASIAIALLIGDQKFIANDLLQNIRKSGLSHLLSISGFHLSLASAIFFVSIRFLLANIEFIALRFDIKKISAIFAICASFIYLKIANAPIPAQRALIMVWLAMFALIFDSKFNAIRGLFFALIILILINPLAIFQVSFLLSFSAVLIIVCYYQNWRLKIFPDANLGLEEKFITGFLSKIRLYFIEIFFLTLAIQIATLPIIMNNFQTVSLSSFLANLIAIPFVSFIVMPLSFLALLLMVCNAQILPLFLLKFALNFFIKIADYFANFQFSYLPTPYLENHVLAGCLLLLAFFCISRNNCLKIFFVMGFLVLILSAFSPTKNQIIFEKSQKFYAVFLNNKLYFSRENKGTKQVKRWLHSFNQNSFNLIKNCNNNLSICKKNFKKYEELKIDDKFYLIIRNRLKISKICQKKFLKKYIMVVNFSKKYKLPKCVNKFSNLGIIENHDFLSRENIIIDLK